MRYHHWWPRDCEEQATMRCMFEITDYNQLKMKKSFPLQKLKTEYLYLPIQTLGLSYHYGGKANPPLSSLEGDRIAGLKDKLL